MALPRASTTDLATVADALGEQVRLGRGDLPLCPTDGDFSSYFVTLPGSVFPVPLCRPAVAVAGPSRPLDGPRERRQQLSVPPGAAIRPDEQLPAAAVAGDGIPGADRRRCRSKRASAASSCCRRCKRPRASSKSRPGSSPSASASCRSSSTPTRRRSSASTRSRSGTAACSSSRRRSTAGPRCFATSRSIRRSAAPTRRTGSATGWSWSGCSR